jgi:hypothetical protein
MKKIILTTILLVLSSQVLAMHCSKENVKGSYAITVNSSNDDVKSQHVGRVVFSEMGSVSLQGLISQAGSANPVNQGGTYSVSNGCLVVAILQNADGIKSNVWIYLDKLEKTSDATRASHGKVIIKSANGFSGSGAIVRDKNNV